MLTYLLALTLPVAATALLYARYEYRKRGKLTFFGLALLCAMLFVPNLVIEFATTFAMPSTLLDGMGVLVGIVGIVLCLRGVIAFRSLPKVLCLDPGELAEAGAYRWSRNPQYVGWFLFLLGFALNDWSLWCLGALLVVLISLHFLVLIEEEHLRRIFGAQYVEFCRRTPRYLGWGPLRLTSS